MIRVLTADELKDLAGDRNAAGFGAIDTDKGCLPLTALDVDVEIEGLAAATTVRQQFRNVFEEPLEATYIFPLPPRAAVTGFRMTVKDAVIEGRIAERGKAREEYDAAIAEGRTASIAEQERADVFTLRVGNIPPRSTARIELTLVGPLGVDSLEATYRFPLVVAPRYCPGAAIDGESVGDGITADTDLVPDASRISPPVLLPGFESPVQLGVRVRIAAEAMAPAQGRFTGSLGCTLPVVEEHGADGSLTVTVVPWQRLDRDFVLRWGIAAETVAHTTLLIEPDAARPSGLGTGKPAREAPGDGTFSLMIVPPKQGAQVKQAPRDVVFLLDRSGSMGGWQMVAARRAVARMVDTLSATDRVAVMAFDTSIEHRGDTPTLMPATDRHRWSLLEWLGGIEARGGTALAAAIKAGFGVFRGPGDAESAGNSIAVRDRVLVLVTDCQVGDEDQVLADLVGDIGDVTLFVVGIDTAVNEGLLSRMADLTGGGVEIVESEDRLDEVMQRIQRRLATPLVGGLRIERSGLDILPESLVPAKLPNLVPGVPVIVRGRYRGKPEGGVRVEGTSAAGDPWQAQAAGTTVATGCQGSLWARGRLQHLEDCYAIRTTGGELEGLSEQMVELSTAFSVLCRFTAIVAIDPRNQDLKTTPAALRRIVQPVGRVMRLMVTNSFRSSFGAVYHKRSPGQWMLQHSCFVESVSHCDPLEAARMMAAGVLAKARPKSDAIRDIRASKVRALLKAVLALLKELGANGASPEQIESLAIAYGRLYARPTGRDAITAMLDVLADIAEQSSARGRWWRVVEVDGGSP